MTPCSRRKLSKNTGQSRKRPRKLVAGSGQSTTSPAQILMRSTLMPRPAHRLRQRGAAAPEDPAGTERARLAVSLAKARLEMLRTLKLQDRRIVLREIENRPVHCTRLRTLRTNLPCKRRIVTTSPSSVASRALSRSTITSAGHGKPVKGRDNADKAATSRQRVHRVTVSRSDEPAPVQDRA